MDRLRATLGRRVGPFTVGQWLIVLVGGIALGLMVRRGFGRTLEAEPPAVMGDDFPLGIDRGVVVTGRAPTTVYFDDVDRTVDQDGISEKPAPKQTGTDKPSSWWQYLVNVKAIHGDPNYYAEGRAQEFEYEHALRVADRNLARDNRVEFWKALVRSGHIEGDPSYYYEGRAQPFEYEHAYKVAAKSLAGSGGKWSL